MRVAAASLWLSAPRSLHRRLLSTVFFRQQNSASACGTSATVDPVVFSGIKVYSVLEIEQAKGLEKDFRRFWNEKVREIYSDKVLHKVDLMAVQVDEFRKLANQVYREDELHHKLKSVEKNLDRMHTARKSVGDASEELKVAGSAARKSLTAKITEQMSELRKAQDALQKALERKLEEIKLLKLKQEDAEREYLTSMGNELTQGEIEGIAGNVKEDLDFLPLEEVGCLEDMEREYPTSEDNELGHEEIKGIVNNMKEVADLFPEEGGCLHEGHPSNQRTLPGLEAYLDID